MKGEQQEERVPNFIGNAVIILTASHLGLSLIHISEPTRH